MAYFLNLFTPETWTKFREHGSNVSGFRWRQRRIAQERINPGDIFLCYLVRLSRWCGVLEITSKAFIEHSPIFSDPDPFIVRFKVTPVILLDPETSIPIFENEIWNAFSETMGVEKRSRGWAKSYFRASLRQMDDADGDLLRSVLKKQNQEKNTFPFTERDKRQISRSLTVRTLNREVAVEVPGHEEEDTAPEEVVTEAQGSIDATDSVQMQAKVARIGAEMGFRIWIPRSDRVRVLELIPEDLHEAFLKALPLNYDDTTLRTIEQIDVIWLKGRSMARAFEVEHTTAVYSGLLRMADLLALQPNMDIHLHIVAPDEKREKVLREIKRPVFSLLDQGPLYEKCTFLSYDSVNALGETRHLSHMSDSIIEEYEESAED